MATFDKTANSERMKDAAKEDNQNVDEDDIPNIYQDVEPDDFYHLDFHSGIDLLEPSLHLRDLYDDIESMWTSSDQYNTTESLNRLKTAFARAAEAVGEKRFCDEITWLACGSSSESNFFFTKYVTHEFECRQKIFGDNYSGIGERHFQEYLRKHKENTKSRTLGKAPLLQANDYDYMLTPKSLILSDTDCVVRKSDTPGFLKVQVLNSELMEHWNDSIKSASDHCDQFFISPSEVKKKLKKILIQLEHEGPYIVKEGSVAFQIADLSSVSGGIEFYDIVVAIKCTFWPSMASEWITRARQWPNKEDIQAIVAGGFHLVPKINPLSVDHLDWRVSFSQAELSLTNLPLLYHYGICHWRVLKSLFSSDLQVNGHPKLVTSYHLKTIILYALERIKYDHWLNREHLLKTILGIMDDLLICLATHKCPHYFIPEINLFANQIPHDDFYPLVAEQVLSLRKKVAENPGEVFFGEGGNEYLR